MRVISESSTLRGFLERVVPVGGPEAGARVALLLGRPAADSSVGSPTWVLYESGDVVLRRSRAEDEMLVAAAYHLASLQAADRTQLLPLRVRTILLPDGSAVLATPGPITALAGHDRRLHSRGCLVLPTTVAVVDAASAELVLVDQSIDEAIPSGRRPIRSIMVIDRNESQFTSVAPMLSLARHSLRMPSTDLQSVLVQIEQLVTGHPLALRMSAEHEIIDVVNHLGGPAKR